MFEIVVYLACPGLVVKLIEISVAWYTSELELRGSEMLLAIAVALTAFC